MNYELGVGGEKLARNSYLQLAKQALYKSSSRQRKKEKLEMKGDVEEGLLYPGIGNKENELRWGFIRKVYYILAFQILLTTIVSSVAVLYTPVNNILHGKTILLILLILPLLCKSIHVPASPGQHIFILSLPVSFKK